MYREGGQRDLRRSWLVRRERDTVPVDRMVWNAREGGGGLWVFGSDGSVSASTYNTLYEDSKPPSSFASTCCSPSWAAPKTSFSTGTEKVPGTTDARDSETFMPLSRPSYVLSFPASSSVSLFSPFRLLLFLSFSFFLSPLFFSFHESDHYRYFWFRGLLLIWLKSLKDLDKNFQEFWKIRVLLYS